MGIERFKTWRDLLEADCAGGRELSVKQYMTLRDGGFAQVELQGKTHRFYDEQKENVQYDGHKSPALSKQIAYLESLRLERNDVGELTYGDCRRMIRNYAKAENLDEKYIKSIETYEKNNAGRNGRRRGIIEAAVAAIGQSVVEEPVAGPIIEKDAENVLDSVDAFLANLTYKSSVDDE
jgi:hypothetical protein